VLKKMINKIKRNFDQIIVGSKSTRSQAINPATAKAQAEPAIIVDMRSRTKTERKITTKKPLSVMVCMGKKTVSRIVITKANKARAPACLLLS